MRIKKSISFFLIIISFFGLAGILYENRWHIQGMWAQFSVRNLIFLGIATFIATISIGLLMPIFQILLIHNTKHNYRISFIAKLFYGGQIVSYIPGRFLGVTYLITETHGTIPALTMLRVNVELIAMILVFNLVISLSIIAYYSFGLVLGISVFVLGQFFFILYLKNNLGFRLVSIMKRFFPERIMAVVGGISFKSFNFNAIVRIISLLIAHWLLYLAAWHLLHHVFESFSNKNMFLLCADYALSWIIGFVCLLTPGGIGIREASFIFLSNDLLSQYQASFFAIFLRIWLVIIDFILFFMSCLLSRCSTRGDYENRTR
jgi:hypothetical protein